ncbi:hypothetical protein L1987_10574 [Smallanthus sonchifolius]|uniref:Uncharacterized protein n=1 Tax=Smallanthus sonchifolius TaxID=185202 RepID=A0ACB9JSF8_9ASTR|nr:hypothetical protein L1987_10574 [Smallanthus sonchifolius]
MFANIPFEIQVEITKRTPVKSLIRFRSVSKRWKSVINSSEFISAHSVNQTQQHHLLVRYKVDFKEKYVMIVDDDSFPNLKFSPPRSPTVELKESLVVLNYYADDAVCDVWVMLKNAFTKLSTVKVNESDGRSPILLPLRISPIHPEVQTSDIGIEMSANIPFEIQLEIIKRVVPVKSLIRFRSLVTRVLMLDSSHGLVCLYGFAPDIAPRNKSIVVWNPSIRKSVCIVLPYKYDVVGFGVCPKTSDPTIVTITCPSQIHAVDRKAEVFTLSSRAWRSISMNLHMPLKSIEFRYNQVVIDGVIHWIAIDSLTGCSDMIISFDLASEEFGEIDLPGSLAHLRNLYISKLKESLAVLHYDGYEEVCDVWMMTKNGDMKSSFAKLFTVSFEAYYGCILNNITGFRKNGEPIREHRCDGFLLTTLEAYEPSTKLRTDLGVYVTSDSPCMMTTSYTESLLLLHHSDSIIR